MSAESPLRDGDAAGYDLIETMRWEPATGFLRLDRHLARLRRSAGQLGFAFDQDKVELALDSAVGADASVRARLTLAAHGTAACTTAPFEALAPGTIWRIAIARTRLDSADPLLRHKTTRRDAYAAARAEYGRDEADEVILLNERGEVCEGTITNLFADHGGILLTPPLACGLLPGVLRAEMIDSAAARQAPLSVGDLRQAKALFVGNSLRGLIPAAL